MSLNVGLGGHDPYVIDIVDRASVLNLLEVVEFERSAATHCVILVY